MNYTGSCLCGGVRFRVEAELPPIQVCHCQQCRKAQGGPFATNMPVPAEALRFECGEDLLKAYESSPGKERVFCSNCGSPVLSRRQSLPGVVRLRAGLVNEPIASGLAWHAYYDSRCNWWHVEDNVPKLSEGK